MSGKDKMKFIRSYWYVLLIVPFLMIGFDYYILDNKEASDSGSELDLVVGFYISGESFSEDLINDDISDTIGLRSDKHEFYYLVDYSGFGNTHFFTGRNYTREYLNISEIMPYDSDELDMGNKDTLSGFSQYVSEIPAKLHCLVVWGHGRGSEGVCFDGSSSLKGEDISNALTSLSFDLVIFDACDMSTARFLMNVSDISDYILASQKDIPDRGINYAEGIVNYIQTNEISPVVLGKHLIDSTIYYYQRNPSKYSVQLSLINCQELDEIESILSEISEKNLTSVPDPFESGNYVDLKRYLNNNEILRFDEQILSMISYQNHLESATGLNVNGLCGISIRPKGQ